MHLEQKNMIMKRIVFLVLTLLTLTLTSCDRNDSQTNNDIIGEWNWLGTDGGIAFHIHDSPASTEKVIIITLNNDYSYSVIENDILISKGTYDLSTKKSIHNHKMTRFIQISDTDFNSPIVMNGLITIVDNEELHISDNMHDGIGSGFERTN